MLLLISKDSAVFRPIISFPQIVLRYLQPAETRDFHTFCHECDFGTKRDLVTRLRHADCARDGLFSFSFHRFALRTSREKFVKINTFFFSTELQVPIRTGASSYPKLEIALLTSGKIEVFLQQNSSVDDFVIF